MVSDRAILRYAGGWIVVMLGGLLIVAYLQPDDSSLAPNYLIGVWLRSFSNPLQLGLLAAALAVIPHFLWTRSRAGPKGFADGYDAFGSWGQTILTSLGFLGTVVGVSLAVAGLEQAMRDQETEPLIRGLSTAFDTTFLGLTGAIQLMFLRQIARREAAE